MANQNQEPFVHIDPATEAEMRRRGADPHELERCTVAVFQYLVRALPDPPVNAAAFLSALPGPDPSGADRISALPFTLLRDIVSRLPIKDAARTAVLSRRWRPVWRCSPLAFADAHLIPGILNGTRVVPGILNGTRADTPALAATISRVLATHPGPFRAVHLLCCYMGAYPRRLQRWVQMLVDKEIQELVLVNRPWPRDMLLPAELLAAATLTRLFLGFWKFPDTSTLPHGGAAAAFPNLRELVLSSMDIESRDLDFLLTESPALEKLGIQSRIYNKGIRLRLVGQRLRCVQVHVSAVESITVVDAPCLERLFLSGSRTHDGSFVRVKIGNAPKLRLLGYLEPGTHMLEIGNSVINFAGTSSNLRTMAPNVKILGLYVRFGVHNDVKMLPAFLRCFPNFETLHIMSGKTEETTCKLNLKFWQEAGPIESIRSHIKTMIFREFQGGPSEAAFLKFMFQTAQVLKNAVIVGAKGSFTSIPEVIRKVQTLTPENWGSNCSVHISKSSGLVGGELFCLRAGFEFSISDPFRYYDS